jgi:hypothetical protein
VTSKYDNLLSLPHSSRAPLIRCMLSSIAWLALINHRLSNPNPQGTVKLLSHLNDVIASPLSTEDLRHSGEISPR